jgi:putative mycofactocin binding protein MftB
MNETPPGLVDESKTYRAAPGFGWRREEFGGILFHFEGRAPDPRLLFVESRFLIDLLELVDHAPLHELLEQAARQFRLSPDQDSAMRAFFQDLVRRKALVPQS